MSVAAVIEDWPTNSNISGEVFGSSLAPGRLGVQDDDAGGGMLANVAADVGHSAQAWRFAAAFVSSGLPGASSRAA